MKKMDARVARVQELKEMLAEYRRMTIDEVETTGWGDREIEIEGEVWRLEMEMHSDSRRPFKAA